MAFLKDIQDLIREKRRQIQESEKISEILYAHISEKEKNPNEAGSVLEIYELLVINEQKGLELQQQMTQLVKKENAQIRQKAGI